MSIFGVVVGVVVGTLIGIALSYAVPDSFIDGDHDPVGGADHRRDPGRAGGRRRRPVPGVQGVAHERARGDRHRNDMATAGYSGTPLPQKLGIKQGTLLATLHAPDDFGDTLGELPPEARAADPGADRSRPRRRLLHASGRRCNVSGRASRRRRAERHGVDRLAEEGRARSRPTSPRTSCVNCCCRPAGSTTRCARSTTRGAASGSRCDASCAASARVAGTPREIVEEARRRRMRIHRAHVAELAPSVAGRAAPGTRGTSTASARSAPRGVTRSSRDSDGSPARCARTRPGPIQRRRRCASATAAGAQHPGGDVDDHHRVVLRQVARRAPTGLISVAHSTSQR